MSRLQDYSISLLSLDSVCKERSILMLYPHRIQPKTKTGGLAVGRVWGVITFLATCTQTHTHTCSEQSLPILMWNASYVQNHSIKPDGKSMKTRSEKNLEVCISTSLLDANRSIPDIKFGLKFVWKRHAGSWLSRLPLTKNWKIAGTFSQEHCSVFVGRWLQCSPAAPCLKWNERMPTKIREV